MNPGSIESADRHVPVLYKEVLEGLRVRPNAIYVDATVGAAGHASGILRATSPEGQLLGLDADAEAIAFARQVLRPFGNRAILQVANFRSLKPVAESLSFDLVDGVLMDLGLSSRQLANPGRGFAFSQAGPLDMRFDRSQKQSAADLVNRLPESALAELLWRYGEERQARRIARAIVAARPLATTEELADLVTQTVGWMTATRQRGRSRIHPATRTFQALRIAVNDELGALEEALPQALEILKPGGRLAVISFHSLEDRLVKHFYQKEARDCVCPPETPVCTCQHRATIRLITHKPIYPQTKEVAQNPRSRSAKLRIAERLEQTHTDQRSIRSRSDGRR
jgi:16S rRNA (cytosine1402-N4)-methyltransferase